MIIIMQNKKENKMRNTKVFDNKFKENKMFTIAEIDENGELVLGKKFVVNIGIKKAAAILEHIEELKEYVEQNK